MPKKTPLPKKATVRKHVSADALNRTVHQCFQKVPDHRCAKDTKISLADMLMAGYAMFQLKDPSLNAFDKNRRQKEAEAENLKAIYGMQHVPADTTMADTIDCVSPTELREPFNAVFNNFQRSKGLERMKLLGGYCLVGMDGTGSYSSEKISSESCQKKVSRKTGKVTYYQQVVGAAIVHPDQKAVLPLPPEMVIPQDGENKNDCERNASRRSLRKIRKDHPKLPMIITEDALSANAPHIRDLEANDFRFILAVKSGDHEFFYSQIDAASRQGEVEELEIQDKKNPQVTHEFRFVNQVPLNQSNQDILVNFIAYREISPQKTKEFNWITDLTVTRDNIFEIMRAGRARWKIENETFNTLKNQGYHFERNFGLGEKHLSENFVHLMMLAFLVDQVQQLACPLFQAVLQKAEYKKHLWEEMRAAFKMMALDSMETLFKTILYEHKRQTPVFLNAETT
jgi:hypothetical protein